MLSRLCLPVTANCLIIGGLITGLAGAPALAAPPAPGKGLHKDQVAQTHGKPLEIKAAVGDPPITRWVYEGYTVYFDRDYVIHSVFTDRDPAPARTPAQAPAGGVGAAERGDADMATP